MGPVIKRIAHRIRKRSGPFLKFLPIGFVTGNIGLFDAVGPHCTPLVMVAAEPRLGNVPETAILRDHLRHEVAMVIDDRHPGSMFVIQLPRRIVLQHEILSDELAHDAQGLRPR